MMPNAIKRHMAPAPLTQNAEARKKSKEMQDFDSER